MPKVSGFLVPNIYMKKEAGQLNDKKVVSDMSAGKAPEPAPDRKEISLVDVFEELVLRRGLLELKKRKGIENVDEERVLQEERLLIEEILKVAIPKSKPSRILISEKRIGSFVNRGLSFRNAYDANRIDRAEYEGNLRILAFEKFQKSRKKPSQTDLALDDGD